MSIGGQRFDRGVGTHAHSALWVRLDGGTERFQARVGVDDAAGNPNGSVNFRIVGDGRKLWESGLMKTGTHRSRSTSICARQTPAVAGDGWRERRRLRPCRLGGRPVPRLRGEAGGHRSTEPERAAVILTPKPGPARGSTGQGLRCRPETRSLPRADHRRTADPVQRVRPACGPRARCRLRHHHRHGPEARRLPRHACTRRTATVPPGAPSASWPATPSHSHRQWVE